MLTARSTFLAGEKLHFVTPKWRLLSCVHLLCCDLLCTAAEAHHQIDHAIAEALVSCWLELHAVCLQPHDTVIVHFPFALWV